MTIISAASIGIGSVGTSPLPILVTTFSISGNLSNKIFDAFCVYSTVVAKLLPVKTLVSIAKSPSSNAGINSPPKNEKAIKLEINKPTTADKIALG